MRLIEVIEDNSGENLKRKIASFDAIINDPGASAGEKANAIALKDRLTARLQSMPITSVNQNATDIKQRLMMVLQSHADFCERAGWDGSVGFNWVRFIAVLNRTFRDICMIDGRSPSGGDYQIATDFNRLHITISYSRSYAVVRQINQFIGKLLFADLQPIIERMVSQRAAA